MNKISFILLLIGISVSTSINAQSISDNKKSVYHQAFAEQLQMLEGQRQLDFKRSVFITENAYYENKMDYEHSAAT